MDWFQRWPKEALVAVADHFLAKSSIDCSAEVKKQVIQTMGNVHDGVAEYCIDYFQRLVITVNMIIFTTRNIFNMVEL